MSETLYVGKFTVHKVPITHTDKFPNDLPKYNPNKPSQAPFQKLFEFPITAVVHNTHTKEKRAICQKQDGNARFKANPKLARSKSRKLYYAKDRWNEEPIEKGEELIPGKYVWFSMKPTLPKDPEFDKEDYNVCYVNGTSFYGPWTFTFDYSQLIRAYKEHIENHSDPNKRDAAVVLRNGGTLMYQKEICYVVIVTHSKDTMHDNLHYPILQQYDDMLTTPYCVFHPRCLPPPFVPKCSRPPQNWAGYDFQKLGHYDQIAFAINCDWKDEVTICSKANPVEELTPVFKIPLPPGEPHCYFEDCEDDTEKAYCDFHPICHRDGNNQANRAPSCYSDEHTQWFTVEMPKKIKEMAKAVKEIANEFDKCITTDSIKGIVVIGGKVTEMALKACIMAKKPTEMEGSEEEDPANIINNKLLLSLLLLLLLLYMTNSAEVALKAMEMAQMAEAIAAMPGHTDDEDELAKMARKIAQQKVKVAKQKMIPGVANQIADQMEKLAETQLN